MIIKIDFNYSISHAGNTMNSSLHRNTCENAINKEPISSMVAAKSKPKPQTPIISYDYEAAISQPDIPIHSKINNMQNVSLSETSDKLSALTKKRNFYEKTGVTTKKRGIVFKSKKKIQAKKVTKTHPSICEIAEIKKESISSSEIIRDVENYRMENNDGIILNRQMLLNEVCFNTIFTLNLLTL